MSLPYSTSFLQMSGVTSTVSYTCPPGFVAVVHSVDLYDGGGVLKAQTYVMGAAGQTFMTRQWNDVIGVSVHWDGRVVLNEGETVSVRSDRPVDVTICGYLLSKL